MNARASSDAVILVTTNAIFSRADLLRSAESRQPAKAVASRLLSNPRTNFTARRSARTFRITSRHRSNAAAATNRRMRLATTWSSLSSVRCLASASRRVRLVDSVHSRHHAIARRTAPRSRCLRSARYVLRMCARIVRTCLACSRHARKGRTVSRRRHLALTFSNRYREIRLAVAKFAQDTNASDLNARVERTNRTSARLSACPRRRVVSVASLH